MKSACRSCLVTSSVVESIDMPFTIEQKKDFDELYNKAINVEDDVRLVKMKDDLLRLLVDGGEARVKYLHPKSVVPHAKNRGGAKMQWLKIFEKGAKIIKVGVSLAECGPSKAVAFDKVDNESAENWGLLCATSEHYPKFDDPDFVEAGSTGCGHWNQFLACIIDGALVPEQFRAILCEPGCKHLDAERLCRDQPVLRTLLTSGLQFTTINKRIENSYGHLPNILQKALNVEHHIGEGALLHVC